MRQVFGIGAVLGGMFAVMLQGEYGWRSVFLAGAILTGLLLVVLFIWLPESIDFLTSKQPKNAEVRLNLIAFFMQKKLKNKMAGVLGFEPRDAEIKTRCLTAWRYPNYYLTAS